MNWMELLQTEIESAYRATEKMAALVEAKDLAWKPATGSNWMTTGQLLKHLTGSCGHGFRGCITGDWGIPKGVDVKDLKPAEMLPPAEKLPTVASVAEAQELFRKDHQIVLEVLATCTEEKLAQTPTPFPWDPRPLMLGYRLLQMLDHLKQHKAQLFYYLKLQGKAVNTGTMYGM